MGSAEALQVLLDCMRQRGILLTRADIEWAFDSPKHAKQIEAFVTNHLDRNRLLSLEEKELYETLKSKGLLSNQTHLGEPDTGEENANDALQALEYQNEILKGHIDRLDKLKGLHQTKLKAETRLQTAVVENREDLHVAYASERDRNAVAIGELETNFHGSFADSQNLLSGKLDFQTSAMSEATRADDRLLGRLQMMMSDIVLASEASGEDLVSDASQYADMLATLEEQVIKTRLDRLFTDFVAVHKDREAGLWSGEPEYFDKQEFNDLIVEISSVASMRAKEGLMQPIMEQLVMDNKFRTSNIAQRCQYILQTISLLNDRNKSAETEMAKRNSLRFVSSRVQMLFELSMRDFNDAMVSSEARTVDQKQPASATSASDERSYTESRVWRSLGINSLASGDSLQSELSEQSTRVQAKEDLYKNLASTHSGYLQEEEGIATLLRNFASDSANGEGSGAISQTLKRLEERVKSTGSEIGQIGTLMSTRDVAKATVMNYLKEKETYG